MVLCTRLHGRQGRTSRVDSQTRDNYAELLHVALVAVDNGDFIPGGVCFSPPFTMQAVGVLTLCTTSLYEACKNVHRSRCQGVRKCFSPEAPLIAHFDGNFLPDCSAANADHMPVVVLGKNVEKMLAILGQEVAVVEKFVYLGSLAQSTTQSSPDISCLNAITRAAMQNLDNQIWKSRITIQPSKSCITHAFYLSSCMALSAGQSPREMYSRLMPSISVVCESCQESRAEWLGEMDNWATTPVGYCPSMASFPARPPCMNA